MQDHKYSENCECDSRKYELTYMAALLPTNDVSISLTQRELRIIIKHVDGRNDYITQKLKDFIEKVDEKEKRHTNWHARVPRTAKIFVH